MNKKIVKIIEEPFIEEQVNNDNIDTSSNEIVKKKTPRSAAQIRAFTLAREKRAENIASRKELVSVKKDIRGAKAETRKVVRAIRDKKNSNVKDELQALKYIKNKTSTNNKKKTMTKKKTIHRCPESDSESDTSYSQSSSSSDPSSLYTISSDSEPEIIIRTKKDKKKKSKAKKQVKPIQKKKKVIYLSQSSSSSSSEDDTAQGGYAYEEPTATDSYLKYFHA